MNRLEYIPGDLVSVYVGIKKYIVEVIGTENENEVLSYQIKFQNGEPYKDVNEAWGIDYFSLEKVVE